MAQVKRVEKGQLVLEDVPDIPAELSDRLAQYQNTRWASAADFGHNGGIYIRTRFAETVQLHFVEFAGGARKQLTFFPDAVSGVNLCPDPGNQSILFTKDTGGSEFYQIYRLDLLSAKYSLMTDGKSKNEHILFNLAGSQYAYYSTRRNGKDWDIYLADTNGWPDFHSHKLVHESQGSFVPVDFSRDGSSLLLRKYVSATESHLFILNLQTLESRPLLPDLKQKAQFSAARFSADGKQIYTATDIKGQFRNFTVIDVATGTLTTLMEDIPWDVEAIELSPDGRTVAFTTNEDACYSLYLYDLPSSKRRRLVTPVGTIGGLLFDRNGDKLAVTMSTPQTPHDVFVIPLLKHEVQSRADVMTDSVSHPEREFVHFPSFDGLEIPAFVYANRHIINDRKFPVIIDIHGGPESQSHPTFNPMTQFYACDLGVAVIVPNVRGSTGYGKQYVELDNCAKREDSVKDIGALLDWIATQDYLDASRVIVRGGSYGGYMVLACMIHYGDRLLAGSEIVGISNFITFLENTQEYRRDLRRIEYGDERDPEMRKILEQISPLTNAHKIKKPMFVAQGFNDPRVPVGESEQIVQAIRKNGCQVWYMLAKDEGHGFQKKSNRDAYTGTEAMFMRQCFGL